MISREFGDFMKILIIPISLSLLQVVSCKSLRSGYDVKDPSANVGSKDLVGDKVIIKEDGTGKTSTTPEIPHSIPTPPVTAAPGNSGSSSGSPDNTAGNGSGSGAGSGNTGGTGPSSGTGPGSGTDPGSGTGPGGGGSVQPPEEANETLEPILRPEIGLAPDPISTSGGNGTNVLLPNQELSDGQSLKSTDGRFTLLFKANGNARLIYKERTLWSSDTEGRAASRMSFQNDGNLVIYQSNGAAIWASNTNNRNGKSLRLTNDGSLAIYTTDGNIIWSSGSCCFPPASAYDERPIAVGKWGPTIDWPIIPIHSILMPNGKVLSYGTDSRGLQGAQLNYDLWTPSKGTGADSHQTLPNNFNTDIFCGSPIILPKSGDALLPGGDMRASPNTNAGIDDTLILKRDGQSLTRGPYMGAARWYATSTTLPNGDILIHGGVDGSHSVVTAPEIYSPSANAWTTLTGAASSEVMNSTESKWFYPRNFIAPDGRLFGLSGEQMYYINTSGSGSLEVVGKVPSNSRSYTSTAIMFEPGKIIQMGGSVNGNIGARASDQAIQVDLNSGNPVVSRLNPMAFERAWGNSTVLPSGEVFVSGGSARENQMQDLGYTAELWSPASKSFRPLLPNTKARLYHSTSLLLPDASVLVGGGGAPGPQTNLNAEIYYPPYLFNEKGARADRPSITSGSEEQSYGTSAKFGVSGKVSKVVLIKTGAVTHSFDFDQRFINLSFTKKGDLIETKMPDNSKVATPGFYHLFVLNNFGVPSVSKIISLSNN
jgi:hypothetical protein